jgi:OOP family OmpA-OmpF porin
MKNSRITNYFFLIVVLFTCLEACKAKKIPPKPAPPAPDSTKVVKVLEAPKPPEPASVPPPPPPPLPPTQQQINYNFSNIQFEFNSSVLKTESYPILDNEVLSMKADPSVKFTLSGYASAEGTEEHNMQLSIDRANAVKVYLINAGISADNLTAKGFGQANPVADNGTEEGRVLNRRVEVKKQ